MRLTVSGLQRLQSYQVNPLYLNEGWQYNTFNQLTEIDKNGSPFVSYVFTAGANNGQMASATDRARPRMPIVTM